MRLAFTLVGLAALLGAVGATAGVPGRPGLIAFVSERVVAEGGLQGSRERSLFTGFPVPGRDADGERLIRFIVREPGRAIINFGRTEIRVRAMAVALQPDGKIVVAGKNGRDFAVARLMS